MKIKNLSTIVVPALIVLFTQACKGIYDNIEPYLGEKVYPAKFDTIAAKIGFERVELDLMKAGRISSEHIYMGKAKKTIIEYDGKRVQIDSIVSWVSVDSLVQPKLYRIKVYTEDEYGNKSVPQEAAVIPYTRDKLNNLAMKDPRIQASPVAAVLDWPEGLSSILLDYVDLSYSYVDGTGGERKGERSASPRIFASNLKAGTQVDVNFTYRVVPKVDGVSILDTVDLAHPVSFNMPTATTPFNPSEPSILRANGVSEFTAVGVASVKKLVFPVHTNSLSDLFYFSNLEEIDLTGGELFKMESKYYNKNGVIATVGGIDLPTFVRRSGDMVSANAQFLVDLIEGGFVKKVKYIPNSMGIDHLISKYTDGGVVELVNTDEDVLLPHNFLLPGQFENNTWWNVTLDKKPTTVPAGSNIIDPFKVTLERSHASVLYLLPAEYQYNTKEYKYLKFKVYAPDVSFFPGQYSNFKRIWPRFMTNTWSLPNENAWGRNLWDSGKDNFKIADSDLGKWVEMTVDVSRMHDLKNRVIILNIGGEFRINTWAPPKPIVYYFANVRLSKD